jgi:uncharacterized protein
MNNLCLFVSDLHGKVNRYEKLFHYIENLSPDAVFIGGDILPASVLHSFRAGDNKPDFISDYLAQEFGRLKKKLGEQYPRIFIIMGNDDPRIEEGALVEHEKKGLWEYIHGKIVDYGQYKVMGYSYVPPTPFLLKDWERYDIDEQLPPLSVHPRDGFYTKSQGAEKPINTIQDDLMEMTNKLQTGKVICLFHSPPYHTALDQINMEGILVENQKIDIHVGSKAISKFIEEQKPYITLHGHIHESSRLSGSWSEIIGQTTSYTAAYDGTGLAVIQFDPSIPADAKRVIL